MVLNGLYNLIAAVMRLGLSIVSVPLLITFLGTQEYGLYTIIIAIINFSALSEWAISMLLTVFLAQDFALNRSSSDTLKLSLLFVLGVSVITFVVLWLLAPSITHFFSDTTPLQQQTLMYGCRLGAFVVLIRFVQQYFVGIEQARGKYKLMNAVNTLFNIAQTTTTILVAYLQPSIINILWSQFFVTLLFTIYHAYLCYGRHYFDDLVDKKPLNWNTFYEMLAYGGRTYVGVVGSALFAQGDRILVGRFVGLEASGIYSAISGIVTQINSLSSMPVQPLIPTVSGIIAKYREHGQWSYLEKNQVTLLIKRALAINACVAVGLGIVATLFAPELIKFIFGNASSTTPDLIRPLRILVIIYTLYSLNAVGYYLLFAVNQESFNTKITLICGILTLTLIGILANRYGIEGAILGNVSYVLTLVLCYKGLRALQLPLSLMWEATYIPLLLFGGVIIFSFLFENQWLRAIISLVSLSTLLLHFLRYINLNDVIAKFKSKATSVQ